MTHDSPETIWQDRAAIERRQGERLQGLLRAALPANAFWRRRFEEAGVDPLSIRTPLDLRQLPLTTKSDLVEDQSANPPYGTNLTQSREMYCRLHQTSGTTGAPLRWLDTPESWGWFMACWRQIYCLVGLRQDDVLAFPFSFGPFIGFWAAFEGANRLGRMCLAGGGMSSQARLRLIEENRATIVCCTPTYALRLAEIARAEGIDLSCGTVRALIVAGEPGGNIPATRSRIESEWGARVFDHWGMTELGSLATETLETPGSLTVLETECIAEVVDPASGEPVGSGSEGELVVTNLGRWGSPLIRYRTGDIVRPELSPDPVGRRLLRLPGGVLGRVDDMVTIRGNNVFPSSVEAVIRAFPEVVEYRAEVRTVRAMRHLRIEIEPSPAAAAQSEQLLGALGRAIKDRLNFHAELAIVPEGSLPRFELKGRRFVRVEDPAAGSLH